MAALSRVFRCIGRREAGQTWPFRGSKSRNKVTVGEPAVGSLKSRYIAYYNVLSRSVRVMSLGGGSVRRSMRPPVAAALGACEGC